MILVNTFLHNLLYFIRVCTPLFKILATGLSQTCLAYTVISSKNGMEYNMYSALTCNWGPNPFMQFPMGILVCVVFF